MNVHTAVKTLLIGTFLALAACGESEPPAPSAEPVSSLPSDAEEQPAAPAEDASAAGETVQSVVEESAADSEPEEQTIVLAQADTKPSQQNFKYKEGTHYTRLVPAQTTIGGADKIEVAEFFWYGCPHCYDLEPFLKRWKETKPANVRFVQVPVSWNRQVETHAKMFYTAEALVAMDVIEDPAAFQQTVFSEIHQRGNRLLSEAAMKSLFASFGVSEDDFDQAWGSFDVDRKLRLASDLARRYSIQSVPAIVVNGKYRTGAQSAGGNAELIEVIDELIARESIR
ncbi:MAG: thiol:disulfide interchange protein DsbA/DsbL [Pseudomonadota bacterium]